MIPYSRMLDTAQHSKALGDIGEYLCKGYLESQGYNVRSLPDGSKSGDLLVNESLKVEVKTSRKTKYGWNFQLFKCDKAGSTNHLNADVIMLLCITKACIYLYLIPVKAVRKKSKLRITSHPTKYRGKLKKYLVKSQHITLPIAVAG